MDVQRRANADPRVAPVFKTSELVMHHVPAVEKGRTKKLAYLWEGPFMIVDIFNNGLNYRFIELIDVHS